MTEPSTTTTITPVTPSPVVKATPVVLPPSPVKPKRTKHWDTRELYKFIMGRQAMPFKWGANDCSMFSADCIQAMTGIDIASDFRGLYTDEAGAAAAIEKVTGVKGGTIEDAAAYCCAKHNIPQWRFPLLAQRGDLVVYKDPTTGVLVSGIIHLSGRHILTPGENGLRKVLIHDGKTTPIVRSWHI